MLQNMSKLISLTAHAPPPVMIQPTMPPSVIPPPSVKITAPEVSRVLPESKKSPTPAPPPPPPMASLPPSQMPNATFPPSSIPVNRGSIMRKIAKKDISSPPPPPPRTQQFNPAQQFALSAEEMMLDLQEKQRKLLSYISAAHGGNVTDEVLHEYLRHPYVLLRENGVTREQHNPFYHLMNQNQANLKMMPPAPSVILKPNEKSDPPIPTPPVLMRQVDVLGKKDTSPIVEKVSPPPQLPPQLPLQVPLMHPHFDPTKFGMPVTRPCNQWSVVSMALPLTLTCVCHQTPCRCKPLVA